MTFRDTDPLFSVDLSSPKRAEDIRGTESHKGFPHIYISMAKINYTELGMKWTPETENIKGIKGIYV